MPDDDKLPGSGGGEPISQDALDALLAASAASGGLDDSSAFDAFGDEINDESDLDFGLAEEQEPVAAAAPDHSAADMFAAASAASSSSFGAGAVDFASFDTGMGGGMAMVGGEPEEFQRVRDIPLDVTVELGRTRLLIKDILDLSQGAIIELDKIAGEPVDLFANGLLVARGEVIVIDDNFGVRVTEIITAEDRIKGTYAQSIAA